jgi:NADH dehydrogenase
VRGLAHTAAKAAERLAQLPVEVHIGDISDEPTLRRAMEGCDVVVHLVAIAVERDTATFESVNYEGTRHVVHAMQSSGVRRLVHMSQNVAASDSPYRFLRSKGQAEDAVRSSGLAWTVLRPSVIFGPEDEFVNVLARLVRLSPVVYPLPGGGRARFQPVHVGDIARAIAVAVGSERTIGHAYALGGPAQLTLRHMVERILLAMHAKRICVPVPTSILRPLVAIAQRVLPRPPVTTDLIDLLAVDNVITDNALRDVFHVTPTPFAAEELKYLQDITIGDAVRSLFGR